MKLAGVMVGGLVGVAVGGLIGLTLATGESLAQDGGLADEGLEGEKIDYNDPNINELNTFVGTSLGVLSEGDDDDDGGPPATGTGKNGDDD